MKKILLLAIAFGLTFSTFAQKKITEGVMLSKQTVSSDNEQIKATLAAMGEIEATTYFKDSKSRSEISNPMSGDVITIMNTESLLTLMDNPGIGKVYTLQDLEKTKDQINSVEVEEGTATKTILGYKCKQYMVTIKQDAGDVQMILYTSEAIPVKFQQSVLIGDKVKGYPLYMVTKMTQAGMNMEITAEITKITEEKVSDDKFDMTPPEGYKKM